MQQIQIRTKVFSLAGQKVKLYSADGALWVTNLADLAAYESRKQDDLARVIEELDEVAAHAITETREYS